MTFEEWWDKLKFARGGVRGYSARELWDSARPQPLTDDEIRECWRACSGSAPMAFAREIQKKLGVTDE